MKMFMACRTCSRLGRWLCRGERLPGSSAAWNSPPNRPLQVRAGDPIIAQRLDVFSPRLDLVLLRAEQLIDPDVHRVVLQLGLLGDLPAQRQQHALVMFRAP